MTVWRRLRAKPPRCWERWMVRILALLLGGGRMVWLGAGSPGEEVI